MSQEAGSGLFFFSLASLIRVYYISLFFFIYPLVFLLSILTSGGLVFIVCFVYLFTICFLVRCTRLCLRSTERRSNPVRIFCAHWPLHHWRLTVFAGWGPITLEHAHLPCVLCHISAVGPAVMWVHLLPTCECFCWNLLKLSGDLLRLEKGENNSFDSPSVIIIICGLSILCGILICSLPQCCEL